MRKLDIFLEYENWGDNMHNITYFNKTLFENMAYFIETVWEVNVEKEIVNVLYDKLTPEWNEKTVTFDDVRGLIRKISHASTLNDTLNLVSSKFLSGIEDIYTFKPVILCNNEYHTIKIVFNPLRDEAGTVKYVYVTMHDIQQHVDSNIEKNRVKKELDRYLSSISCGILQYKLDTNEIIYVNDRALDILGYDSLEEMQKDNFNGVAATVEPEDANILRRLIEDVKKKEEKECEEFEYKVIHKDGTELECYGTLRIIESIDGHPILQRSIVDITEARKSGRLNKEISNILSGAKMGLWNIILDEGEPRFITDKNTAELIGFEEPMSAEDVFKFWYERVDKEYIKQIDAGLEILKTGLPNEATYLYHHPFKGDIIIRCGGIIEKKYAGIGKMIHGYHQDITNYNAEIIAKESINKSVANIYDTMHVMDIENNSYEEIGSNKVVHNILKKCSEKNLQDIMWSIMHARICEAHYGDVKKFTDFSTIDKRMKNKNYIQIEAINVDGLWFRFGFIRIGNKNDKVKKVIYVSQNIDEVKRREENLIMMSKTDRLTGLFNRHAYEENVSTIPENEIGEDLWLIELDINGLKETNDTLGHLAGDELICGTADCLKLTFCNFGQVYRMGGDEFLVVMRGTEKIVENALGDLEKYRERWKGQLVDELSFSKGAACSSEISDCSIRILEKICDDRMYIEKKKFHENKYI